MGVRGNSPVFQTGIGHLMHIPDGLLPAPLWLGGYAIGGATLWLSLRQLNKLPAPQVQVPKANLFRSLAQRGFPDSSPVTPSGTALASWSAPFHHSVLRPRAPGWAKSPSGSDIQQATNQIPGWPYWPPVLPPEPELPAGQSPARQC